MPCGVASRATRLQIKKPGVASRATWRSRSDLRLATHSPIRARVKVKVKVRVQVRVKVRGAGEG